MYQAYVLSEEQRNFLLRAYPPYFCDEIGHHVTHQFGVKSSDYIDKTPRTIEVHGLVRDYDNHVECLLVSVDGCNTRPDGGTYHITLSLDRSKGAKPVMSNDAIAAVYEDNERRSVMVPQQGAIRLTTKIGLTLCK